MSSFPVPDCAPGHLARTTRNQLGSRAFGSGGPMYGTKLRCECGFEDKVNEAPSKGGRAAMVRAYRRHIARTELPAERLQAALDADAALAPTSVQRSWPLADGFVAVSAADLRCVLADLQDRS